ncbi:MAG TPA: porin [Mucilaginibacter sp.]
MSKEKQQLNKHLKASINHGRYVKIIVCALALLTTTNLFAQQAVQDNSKLTISGYADIYYGYDFNKPLNNTRPPFVYSYNRTNEVNIDMGYIKAAYANNSMRANVALMVGTYANANLAAEPGVLKNILEANAGVKLAKDANLWLDAGVFSSHIGFESAIGKDCWTVTRSILADNSPYYESGAKLGYTTNDDKFFISALMLNGWQHIQRPDGNTGLSAGLQVTYKPSDNILINYSNFYGNDKPDSAKLNRFYNNLFAVFQLTKKIGLTAGFDFASEQKYKGASTYNYLYSPVFIVRYTPIDKFAVAARFEYYKDQNGILIKTGTPNGFETTGYSLNVDYSPVKNMLLRVEGKYYNSKDAIFIANNFNVNYNTVITTSMEVSF